MRRTEALADALVSLSKHIDAKKYFGRGDAVVTGGGTDSSTQIRREGGLTETEVTEVATSP